MRVLPLLAAACAALFLVAAMQTQGADAALKDLIEGYESKARSLKDEILSLHSLCDRQTCPCTLSACTSALTDSTSHCTSAFGEDKPLCQMTGRRRLDFDNSVVRTAKGVTMLSVADEACWTSKLDPFFKAISTESSLKWMYFGTPSSFYRIYPGVPQQTCGSYDPRIRPWYAAATSGAKDVVIVVDTSGSMRALSYGKTRFKLAQEAVLAVLETLTFVDYVAIVLFDEAAQTLGTNGLGMATKLVPADHANLAALKQQVRNAHIGDGGARGGIGGGGGTDFALAFAKVWEVLDASKASEATANCHTSVLFLTDGDPTSSTASLTSLVTQVKQRATDEKITVFSYALGDNAKAKWPSLIACASDGIFQQVSDGNDDLRGAMGGYFEYYASLAAAATDDVVWVQPYMDASGAGEMTTASIPVYDPSQNPPRLLGVVGIDVTVDQLEEAAGGDPQALISALAQTSRVRCPALNHSECQLQSMRKHHKGSQICYDQADPCDSSDARRCTDINASVCSPRVEGPVTQAAESCCAGDPGIEAARKRGNAAAALKSAWSWPALAMAVAVACLQL